MDRRPPYGLLALTVLILAGAGIPTGCTTDVVNFPLKMQKKDAQAPQDLFPGNCTTIVTKDMKNGSKRCTYCQAPRWDGKTKKCEYLGCKATKPGDAGAKKCLLCWWGNNITDLCEICWDQFGQEFKDTCHGKDGGP